MKSNLENFLVTSPELEQLGFIKEGKNVLSPSDITSILNGRRTSLLTLQHIDGGSFRIERMQAKISLFQDADNHISLRIHPVYYNPRYPDLLQDELAHLLLDRDEVSLLIHDHEHGYADRIFEFDFETREFLSYFPGQVEVPKAINAELLTAQQQKDFKSGKMITLSDGTHIQHRASETVGVIADRSKLIFSYVREDKAVHLLLEGIGTFPWKHLHQQPHETTGFNRAMNQLLQDKPIEVVNPSEARGR